MSEAPKELYFYDDWLAQHTKGKMLCGNNRYLHESHVDALLKAEREKALREALDIIGMYDENATCSECCDVTAINEAVTALISEDKTNG